MYVFNISYYNMAGMSRGSDVTGDDSVRYEYRQNELLSRDTRIPCPDYRQCEGGCQVLPPPPPYRHSLRY
ncbi:hypothetical protein EB796_005734 [Bugula neritina]|uniref:Uncharacterized protein n=1 Tax=Bugula neritina TaxID=10212 RepID=A0A7J7KCF5_BUGNE|nr:hypothetical protein EB796_005734 [Bugula neritina]